MLLEADNGTCHLFGRPLSTRLWPLDQVFRDVLMLIHRQHDNPEFISIYSIFIQGERRHSVIQSLNQAHADHDQQIRHSPTLSSTTRVLGVCGP